MKRSSFITTTIAAATAAVLLPSCGGDKDDDTTGGGGGGKSGEKILRFSVLPDQKKKNLNEECEKLAKHFSEVLGVKVEYVASNDYQALVENFAQGDIQLGWFGGLTGVEARAKVDGANAIAQGKADPNYFSYFIAHKDSGLEPSDDFPAGLAGKSFTFGSESSTSGRLMPEYFIRKNTDKSPEEFLGSKPGFSGTHDATVEAVASGNVDAGALSYKLYDKRIADGTIDPEVCKVIWKTPFYADYNWTAHPDIETNLGEGYTQKVTDMLLGLSAEHLAIFPRESLIPAKNEDFDGIVKVAKELGFIK